MPRALNEFEKRDRLLRKQQKGKHLFLLLLLLPQTHKEVVQCENAVMYLMAQKLNLV